MVLERRGGGRLLRERKGWLSRSLIRCLLKRPYRAGFYVTPISHRGKLNSGTVLIRPAEPVYFWSVFKTKPIRLDLNCSSWPNRVNHQFIILCIRCRATSLQVEFYLQCSDAKTKRPPPNRQRATEISSILSVARAYDSSTGASTSDAAGTMLPSSLIKATFSSCSGFFLLSSRMAWRQAGESGARRIIYST